MRSVGIIISNLAKMLSHKEKVFGKESESYLTSGSLQAFETLPISCLKILFQETLPRSTRISLCHKVIKMSCNSGKLLEELFVVFCSWNPYLTLIFDSSDLVYCIYTVQRSHLGLGTTMFLSRQSRLSNTTVVRYSSTVVLPKEHTVTNFSYMHFTFCNSYFFKNV